MSELVDAVWELIGGEAFRKAKRGDHFWTSRELWRKGQADFTEAARLIQSSDQTVRYWGREYVVLDGRGWRVWTMGAPPEETIVINAKPLHKTWLDR